MKHNLLQTIVFELENNGHSLKDIQIVKGLIDQVDLRGLSPIRKANALIQLLGEVTYDINNDKFVCGKTVRVFGYFDHKGYNRNHSSDCLDTLQINDNSFTIIGKNFWFEWAYNSKGQRTFVYKEKKPAKIEKVPLDELVQRVNSLTESSLSK